MSVVSVGFFLYTESILYFCYHLFFRVHHYDLHFVCFGRGPVLWSAELYVVNHKFIFTDAKFSVSLCGM